MKLTLLRYLLMLDAALLLLVGACLTFIPRQVELLFHLRDLPQSVSYLLGLWGCMLLTLGCGYVVAATHPVRHLVWIQIGIARGAFECGLGAFYLARGAVTWQQAAFGIVAAGVITAAYTALYPRAAQRSA